MVATLPSTAPADSIPAYEFVIAPPPVDTFEKIPVQSELTPTESLLAVDPATQAASRSEWQEPSMADAVIGFLMAVLAIASGIAAMMLITEAVNDFFAPLRNLSSFEVFRLLNVIP